MPKTRDIIPRTESAKIIVQTVSFITVLLIASILAMTLGTRRISREETTRQVSQTLDGVAYRIDNTLVGVEQTAAIIKADIPKHLGSPKELFKLSRKALEANPDISGCAIALNPDYYTEKGTPFMAYVHRDNKAIVSARSFTSTPFTEQDWYRKPLTEGVSSWTGPLKNEQTETEPIISYDIPIMADGTVIGVLGLDISLGVLTGIAQNYRTSTNSYITLLNRDGSFIVHPDSTKLLHMESLAQLQDTENPVVLEAMQSMVAGESGNRRFTLDSTPYYTAFEPFRPSAQTDSLDWSIAVICPENELFNEFDPGFLHTIIMIIAGVLLLFAGGVTVSRLSLRPLRKLAYMTRIISKGNYRLPGFETSRSDEVGRLQSQYNKMLHSVSDHMEQLQTLSHIEAEHQKALTETYSKTKEIKELKGAFFGNMTHQMTDVSAEIQDDVDKLCKSTGTIDEHLLDDIETKGHKVTEILNDMLTAKN